MYYLWVFIDVLQELHCLLQCLQVNQKFFELNIGIANMHKKYRRQDRDPGWLDHILAR